MLNEFLTKFKKASFSERSKDTISLFDTFSVKLDREKLFVAVMAELSCYVKPADLFEIEKEIKKAYGLNKVTVYPKFKIPFESKYMVGIIETLRHASQLDFGFFTSASYDYIDQ